MCVDLDDKFIFLSRPLPANRGDSYRVRKVWDDMCTEVYLEEYDSFIGDSKFTFLKNEYHCKAFTSH